MPRSRPRTSLTTTYAGEPSCEEPSRPRRDWLGGLRVLTFLFLLLLLPLFLSYVLARHLHDMNRGNHLDSIMRRVKLTDQNSPGTRFEFDREEAPSVPSASKCVVEEIYEEIPHDIMEERDAKVVERQGGDNNATPDIPEAREQTESLLSRESLASSAMFETEVGRGEEERVEYSDGSVYEGDVVMVDGKVVRHGQVGARSASSAHACA